MTEHVSEFEKQAQERRVGLVREVFGFMSENRKWWLFPVIAVMLCAGALVLLAGTGAAPFIYTLF